ncbi:Transposon TX1 uncharacterized 149 kDa protein [Frankliniella fusca]|uniref:Transposon TX1 uncharacterized 149 kDa protein n=1 Tax=Frankliniella fusca TaxID=407009 RepID=A0AAE1HJL9_9NEOP|nr:Transposon TX1 uncharacterized 149 kDa protein [Frankliniella fusca]
MHHVAAAIRKKASSRVERLQDADGNILGTQEELERHAQEHFQRVLGAPPDAPPRPNTILDEAVVPSISDEDNEALLQPITSEELFEALQLSPRGRSPGEDGLTAEFYVTTWRILGKDFLEVTNAMLRHRSVARSHKRGIMTLIPKTATVERIGDLRPITLLNVDGKVFSRVVTRRLCKLQPKLLHPLQVRGGSGMRNMHGALTDLRDAVAAVDLANRQRGSKTAACLVSVDFAGAFNNVRHEYLWEVLLRYGVSSDFVKLVASMYSGATTRIRLNGQLTAAVLLGRGVRQGCPLSMLLFNIIMSPLMKVLNTRLLGLTLPDVIASGATYRLAATAYVDDATALLDSPKEVEVLSEVLELYGQESGLRVNAAKSKALPLGSWQRTTPCPYPYVDQVKILGVTFCRTVAGMIASNWPGRLRALRGALVDARLRVFNICQRVQYCNTYVLSILWHTAQVLPVPAGILRDVKRSLSKLLWAGEPLRVPFDVMVLPQSRGGLGLHDPGAKARAMFTSRWLTSQRSAEPSLSGGWLHVVEALYGRDEELPPPVKYFKVVREVRAAVPVPADTSGKDLNKTLLRSMMAASTAMPRVQGKDPGRQWAVVWRRLHSSLLPLSARAAWFRAVHDVVPTNFRLSRTNQADDHRCTTCGADDTVLHRLTACRPATQLIWKWAARTVALLTGSSEDDVPPDIFVCPDVAAPSKAAGDVLAWILGTVAEALLSGPVRDAGRVWRHLRGRKSEIVVTCPKETVDIINLVKIP